MPENAQTAESINEIYVDPQPSGLRAVYLVETRSAGEARQIADLFRELESRIQVKQLSRGKLVSYAVQAHESDAAALDEIENRLKCSYSFVVTQRSFDELIYRIVKELCRDTGSRLLPVPRCNICGRIEPFPTTTVTMSGGAGDVLISRVYCSGCTAAAVAPNGKQFVRSLLAADRRDFRDIVRAELVRRPSRKRPLRFRIKAADASLSR